MKIKPLVVVVLGFNAVAVSVAAGLLTGGLGVRGDAGRRFPAVRAEAAAAVAVTGVAKEAVRLLVWRVKTGPIQ